MLMTEPLVVVVRFIVGAVTVPTKICEPAVLVVREPTLNAPAAEMPPAPPFKFKAPARVTVADVDRIWSPAVRVSEFALAEVTFELISMSPPCALVPVWPRVVMMKLQKFCNAAFCVRSINLVPEKQEPP